MADGGLLQITFSTPGGESPLASAIAVTDELRPWLRRAGLDPDKFNRIEWPVGAASWASGWFLLPAGSVSDLFSGSGTALVELRMGDLHFDRLWMRNPAPVFVREGQPPIIAVEVVDDRYVWRHDGIDQVAFNLSLRDKTRLFDVTESSQGTPININEIVEQEWPDSEWPLNIQLPQILNPVDVRDVTAQGLSSLETIDRLMTSVDRVVVAFPNPSHPGAFGHRYSAVRMNDGQGKASSMLATFSDVIQHGGVFAQDSLVPPSAGAGSVAGSIPASWGYAEVPEMVRVHFPAAAEGGAGYLVDSEGGGPRPEWEIDRYVTKESDFGRPTNVGFVPGVVKSIFDSTWAQLSQTDSTVVLNDAELETRALFVAGRYYIRFSAGVARLSMAGWQPVEPYAGAHVITWAATEWGPMTKIDGDLHHPLFGFSLGEAARSVYTSGLARGIPRSDGGILIDVLPSKGDVFMGTITAVNGTVNALYDVEADGDSSITMQDKEPLRSDKVTAPENIEMEPALVGDPCIIGIRADGQRILLVPTETRRVQLCTGSAAQTTSADDESIRVISQAIGLVL